MGARASACTAVARHHPSSGSLPTLLEPPPSARPCMRTMDLCVTLCSMVWHGVARNGMARHGTRGVRGTRGAARRSVAWHSRHASPAVTFFFAMRCAASRAASCWKRSNNASDVTDGGGLFSEFERAALACVRVQACVHASESVCFSCAHAESRWNRWNISRSARSVAIFACHWGMHVRVHSCMHVRMHTSAVCVRAMFACRAMPHRAAPRCAAPCRACIRVRACVRACLVDGSITPLS